MCIYLPNQTKLVCVRCKSMYHRLCSSGTKVSDYKKKLKDGLVDLVFQENRLSHLMQAHRRAQVVIHLVYTEEVNQTITTSKHQTQKPQPMNQ